MDTEARTNAGPEICVVVPCHNEARSVPRLYGELSRVMGATPLSLVFVDDGSEDDTLEVVQRLRESDPEVHYVTFSRNFGKEAAIYAGLKRALALGARNVALMDADLQDPPELLCEMCDALRDPSVDVAAAHRVSRGGSLS